MDGVKHIPDGEIITEPGAYRMSLAWYHQQCCDGPSVSSSGLRKIATESPWAFWAASDLNPNRYPPKDESDAFIIGRAAHALILGDEIFADKFVTVPEDAPARPTKPMIEAMLKGKMSDIARERFDFWEPFDLSAKDKAMVTAEQMQRIAYMSQNLSNSPEAKQALTGGMAEVSMVWRDEQTGVWIKSRPDMIPDNGFDFGDLKLFAPRSKNIKLAVHRAITEYRYDMQMALAVMGAEHVFKTTARECVLIFAESSAPFTVTPARIDADTLYWARCENRKAIDTFSACLTADHWPMPVEGIMDYSLPESMQHTYATRQQNGDIPNLER